MTKQIHVTHDDKNYTLDVEEPSSVEKMNLAAKAPDSLDKIAGADDPRDVDHHIDEELIEYMIDVTVQTTDFERQHLKEVPMAPMMELGAKVIQAVFDSERDTHGDRRVKRVRCTQQFIEVLFKSKASIVAGMPDDATFENFEYDPSRQELQFIFSSDEWEEIDEATEIPVHEATVVGIGDDTKEL